MAALIRLSVSDVPPNGNFWPLTACVVTAPNEWPDMPIFFHIQPTGERVIGVLIPADRAGREQLVCLSREA